MKFWNMHSTIQKHIQFAGKKHNFSENLLVSSCDHFIGRHVQFFLCVSSIRKQNKMANIRCFWNRQFNSFWNITVIIQSWMCAKKIPIIGKPYFLIFHSSAHILVRSFVLMLLSYKRTPPKCKRKIVLHLCPPKTHL